MNAAIVWTSAAWALRRYARSGLLLVVGLGLAVAAAVPSLVLGPSLRLRPVTHDDWGVVWSTLVQPPDVARTAGLAGLVGALTAATVGVVAVALLTLLSFATARAAQRRSEIVVRRSAGASRRVLRWAALSEGVVLAIAGVAAGAVGAGVMVLWLAGAWPSARVPGFFIAWPIVTAALAACVVLGALLPLAFAQRRAPGSDARGAAVPLVVPAFQFGLGLLGMIAGAQLAHRAPSPALATPTEDSGVVIPLTLRDSSSVARSVRYGSLLGALHADRRFTLASLASHGTLIGLGTVDYITTECGRCYDGGLPKPLHVFRATNHLASADTFRAMGIHVIEGRGLSDADRWGSPPVAVISRSLALHHFAQGHALGRRLRVGPPEALYTVVGVVEDGRFDGVGASAQPRARVYLSALQHPAQDLELLVRPPARDPAIRAAASIVGPEAIGLPTAESEMIEREDAGARWFARALRWEGAAGMVIAVLGMLAVMRLWVQGVIPEIALRRAVGARRRHVIGRVAQRAVAVVAGGTAIAWWLEPLLSDALRGAVPGVPAGGLSLVQVPIGLLLAATLVAALGPAWNAALRAPATLPGFTDL